eukprot:TRINITY_DN838_c0_g1_i2.p1 TRINITY_DN838_c0_g1~~TRINITY_DN838_c0_g1_i2.p1  ORF type:complete len:671 (-),score=194.36 TRINITY_DN838_c0_g1_i2:348-2138(-)
MYPEPKGTKNSHIRDMDQYKKMYDESISDPNNFWNKLGKTELAWIKPYTKVLEGSFEKGDVTWFKDGVLNVSYNCLDRHVKERGDQVAIIWQGDGVDEVEKVTYKQAYEQTCKFANVLKANGVKKGDAVAIYLPNCPTAAFAMLACARIGAIHSIVFAGFSAESLRDRINDSGSRLVITCDEMKRGGKTLELKPIADEAIKQCPSVDRVLVMRRNTKDISMDPKRDRNLDDEMKSQPAECPIEPMNAEDPLFYLYTSGSTGKPKGLVHTQAGYLLYAMTTLKYTFDIRPGDVYACVADIGWITGHSYIVYGPLANGTTTVMFEGVPTNPTPGRYWEMVEKFKFTQFYTAPTSLRTLTKSSNDFVTKQNRSSLRVLGSVGEPINPETWKWYFEVVGEKRCSIVDTYWQTESGGFLLTPLAGVTPMKAGSATLPFFGVKPELANSNNETIHGNQKSGALMIAAPWPGVARTIYKDHSRYISTYFPHSGKYLTGDASFRDKDGYYWITGRIDDVINISGHRLGTAVIFQVEFKLKKLEFEKFGIRRIVGSRIFQVIFDKLKKAKLELVEFQVEFKLKGGGICFDVSSGMCGICLCRSSA